MTTEGQIMGVIPGVMATSLLGANMRMMKKKKKSTKHMLGMGVTNMAGIAMIGATAGMIPK